MGDKVITIMPDRDIVLVRHGDAAHDQNFKAEMMRLFNEVLPEER
jgi:hypothetical protein